MFSKINGENMTIEVIDAIELLPVGENLADRLRHVFRFQDGVDFRQAVEVGRIGYIFKDNLCLFHAILPTQDIHPRSVDLVEVDSLPHHCRADNIVVTGFFIRHHNGIRHRRQRQQHAKQACQGTFEHSLHVGISFLIREQKNAFPAAHAGGTLFLPLRRHIHNGRIQGNIPISEKVYIYYVIWLHSAWFAD